MRNGATTSYSYVTGTHKLSTAGSGSFSYDYKGNVTSDGYSNVSLTSYDFRNLPLTMTTTSGNFTYKYNDGGNRIYKEGSSTKEYYLYDHTGRALLIYDMNTGNLKTANIYGSGLIGRVDLSGGATGGYYERLYYVKDHPPQKHWGAGLGSTRVTISTFETANNNIAFASDYYPFGETLRDYQVGTKGGKYKFTEKERDAESSYDYFGARYYNNKLGVWLSVDPMQETYPGLNPFNYCANNPMRLVDPNGMSFSDFSSVSYQANWNGNKNDEHNDDGKKKVNNSKVDAVESAMSGLAITGTVAELIEKKLYGETNWFSLKNFKSNSLSWGGNQYTGARALSKSVSVPFKVTARVIGAIDIFSKGFNYIQNFGKMTSSEKVKGGMDLLMKGVGFTGPGFIPSLIYEFTTSKMDSYNPPADYHKEMAPADNTRIYMNYKLKDK